MWRACVVVRLYSLHKYVVRIIVSSSMSRAYGVRVCACVCVCTDVCVYLSIHTMNVYTFMSMDVCAFCECQLNGWFLEFCMLWLVNECKRDECRWFILLMTEFRRMHHYYSKLILFTLTKSPFWTNILIELYKESINFSLFSYQKIIESMKN